MEFLKFDKAPTFDVLERTKEYVAAASAGKGLEYLSEDYVFRGPVVGPSTVKDVRETQKGFRMQEAYPDLDRGIFGYTIDPENPYRCIFFERWTGTQKGDVKLGPLTMPATGKKMETPLHASSLTWNPEGKVIYESISSPIDRFEGNTKGAGAVFGCIQTAGFNIPTNVGDPSLFMQQRLNTALGCPFGKAYSSDEDIPSWWKSKARGGEPNDM